MDELEVVRRGRPQVAPPSPHTLTQIRADLDAAIKAERPQRRRRWYLPGAVVITTAAAVVIMVFGFGPQGGPTAVPPAAAVEIVPDGDYLEVRFLDLSADEDAIEAAIRDAGLDIAVDFMPVSPSLVGSLVASTDTPTDRYSVSWEYRAPSDVGAPSSVRVSKTYRGSLSLTIGRPTKPGEPYTTAAISAELPGELLHCGEITGGTASNAVAVATQREVKILWIDDTSRERLGNDLPDNYDDWYVIAATPISGNEVLIELAPTQPEDGRTPAFRAALQEGC